MPARTGDEYIAGLRNRPPEVWHLGERVEDVTEHPGFRNAVRSVAALYDMQHDPALRDEMTFESPDGAGRVGLSFLRPSSVEDLERRRTMMLRWARSSAGMMGRSPDVLNVIVTALGAAADFFAQGRSEFADNIRRYSQYVRDNDLTLTHTLVNLQRSRSPSAVSDPDQEVALRVKKETDAGVVLQGARILATLGPIADELLVFPSSTRQFAGDAESISLAFAIPCDTPGLKFVCRESLDLERSRFDHPLGSRFDEMDAIVIMDEVVVPWERVFILRDPDLCNRVMTATHASAHMMHHMATKNLAKSEFVLGTAYLMTEALGSRELPQVQERVAELITDLEVTRACLRAAESDASIDEWGVVCPDVTPLFVARNLFPKMYPRMIEILQLLGASSIMAIPSESDFDSPVGPSLDYYLSTDSATGRERAQIFRLAWDVACSAFGSRQVLYERFFAGEYSTLARMLFNQYDGEPASERVRGFLRQAVARADRETVRP